MPRVLTAALLVAVGLAIGLWLGFDPERRAAVEENWQSAGDSIARIQTDLDLELGSERSAPARNDSSNDSRQTQQPSPFAPLARLIQDLWEATQQLWSSLVARVEASG
jgi:hypothetical protein